MQGWRRRIGPSNPPGRTPPAASTQHHPVDPNSPRVAQVMRRPSGVILNVANLLWNTAAAHAVHPAIVEGGAVTDYATLQRRAGGIASALTAAGIRAYDR